jgi:hypothetical protein
MVSLSFIFYKLFNILNIFKYYVFAESRGELQRATFKTTVNLQPLNFKGALCLEMLRMNHDVF